MLPCSVFFARAHVQRRQALLKNLDDTSSTADVLECLAACPQLCSEDRRVLAEEMEPITAPLREWLLNLEGGAPPLRGPRTSSPPQPPAGSGTAPRNKSTGRKGKGKGSNKGKSKGGSGGGGGGGSDVKSVGETARSPVYATGKEEAEVEGEFFSQGRKGEGNRRSARESPELSGVVRHNLVVLLSALHRAPSSPGMVDDDDDDGAGAASAVVAAVAGEDEANDDDCQEASPKADDTVGKQQGTEGTAHGGGAGVGAESRLLAAVDAGGQLARERDWVFGLAEPLLNECIRVAARRQSPQLFGTVVEAKAMLRRRLWSSQDPSALDMQQKEVDVELDSAVPSIKVCC